MERLEAAMTISGLRGRGVDALRGRKVNEPLGGRTYARKRYTNQAGAR